MYQHIMSTRLCVRNSISTHHDPRGVPGAGLSLSDQQGFLVGGASRRRAVFLLTGLLATVVLVLAPNTAWAQDSLRDRASSTWERLRGDPDKIPDRLMIRGGYGYVFGATTSITANGPAGIGTNIDFEQTLGGDSDGNLGRVDAWYRFNSRHSMGFTWYKVDRTGSKVIDEAFEFEGTQYEIGATVRSSIDIELYRLMYNWSFYHNDKVELAISPGVYLAGIDMAVAGNFTTTAGGPVQAGSSSEELTLPLPSIGGLVNYNITPRFQAQVRADMFYLAVGDFRGSMVEFYAGLEYRLFKYFALGVAYDLFAVNVENSDTTDGWKVTNSWNMVFLYGTLYAFDTPL